MQFVCLLQKPCPAVFTWCGLYLGNYCTCTNLIYEVINHPHTSQSINILNKPFFGSLVMWHNKTCQKQGNTHSQLVNAGTRLNNKKESEETEAG